jgi:uncharacterized membrane protein
MRKTIFLACILLFASVVPAGAFLDLFSGMQDVKADNGVVSLDTSTMAAGQSRHYRYREGNAAIRFFVVKDGQGVVRAALDACEVCWRGDKGYRLQDGSMLCVNCGQRFPLHRIGQIRGGCNPHPLAFTMDGQTFAVTTAELMAGAMYTPGNAR